MEYIREIKITVYIDTNKTSYEKQFSDIDEAEEYIEKIKESVYPD